MSDNTASTSQAPAPQPEPTAPRHAASPQVLAPTVDLGRRPGAHAPAANDAAACAPLAGAYSVTGAREKNEDSYLIDAARQLWAVSDGIGGAPFGEVISRVSCNYLPRAWDAASVTNPQARERMVGTIRLVDTYVSELSDLLGHKGSGATLTVAHYDGRTLWIATVGDSRSYLLRDGELGQVSEDGRVSAAGNALDQALGYHLPLRPTVTALVPQPGDVVAICSDGVWSTQPASAMRDALAGGTPSPEALAAEGNPQLMAYQLTQGADMSDNATAVVLLFAPHDEPPLFTPTI